MLLCTQVRLRVQGGFSSNGKDIEEDEYKNPVGD